MADFVIREWNLEPYPGDMAPRHVHHAGDEAFYVLDGSIEVLDGSEWIILGPGEHHIVEKGSVHTFANRGPDVARVLVVMSPEIDALITALHSAEATGDVWADHHSSLAD